MNESDFGARRATTPRARGRHGDPGGRDAVRSVPPRGARGGYARDAIERCVCDGARPTRTPMSDLSSDEDARARPLPSNVPRQPPSSPALTSPPSPTASIARRRARGRERRGRRPPAVIPPRASSRRPRGVPPRAASYRPRSARQPRAPSARTTTTPPAHASPPPRAAPSSLSRPVASSEPSATRTTSSASSAHSECPLPRPDADPSLARVARLSWAADGSALAILVRSGDIHVITRVGARVHTQRARDRPMGARGVPAGIALALAPRRRMGSRRRARVLTPETHRETRAPRGGWRRG